MIFEPKFEPGESALWNGKCVVVQSVLWNTGSSKPFYDIIDPGDENQRHYEVLESHLKVVDQSRLLEGARSELRRHLNRTVCGDSYGHVTRALTFLNELALLNENSR